MREPYETRVRYYGAYATRRRLWWRRGVVPEGTGGDAAPGAAPSVAKASAGDWPALRARRRRRAELLRRVFEIEVSVCPTCSGAMRIVAFVTARWRSKLSPDGRTSRNSVALHLELH